METKKITVYIKSLSAADPDGKGYAVLLSEDAENIRTGKVDFATGYSYPMEIEIPAHCDVQPSKYEEDFVWWKGDLAMNLQWFWRKGKMGIVSAQGGEVYATVDAPDFWEFCA